MKIKELIYDEVSTMDVNDLVLLYEQIRILTKMKNIPSKKKKQFSIEDILEMTSSSKSHWSSAVTEGRAERV